MMYPDFSTEEWIKKYPGLKVVETKCSHCSKPIIANRPFRDKDYVGLEPFPCCVENRNTCCSAIPISKREIAAWNDTLGE